MVWIALALFILLISPVRAGVRIAWNENGLRGAVGLMIWGLRDQVDFSTGRSASGTLRLRLSFRGKSLPLPKSKGNGKKMLQLLGLMLKSNGNGADLKKLVRVNTLNVVLRLGGGDAAALALGAGALRALGGALPGLRFRCVPVLDGQTALRAVCIAESRLGILVMAWLIWKRGESQS